MLKDELSLSTQGKKIYDEAYQKTKNELGKFKRIRTRFYFFEKDKKDIGSRELRDFIEQIINEFHLAFPFDNRESDYSFFINSKFFDVLTMQLHRLYPTHYLIVTQKDNGQVIFIIRDLEISEKTNIKITWNSHDLSDGKVDQIPFYLSKASLE
jgi:hypothetical protein